MVSGRWSVVSGHGHGHGHGVSSHARGVLHYYSFLLPLTSRSCSEAIGSSACASKPAERKRASGSKARTAGSSSSEGKG